MKRSRSVLVSAKLGLLVLSGCSTTSDSPDGNAGLLLSDRQMVRLTITEGPGSDRQGSLGVGKFRQGFRAQDNTFGGSDHPVRVHTATRLTYSGPNTTCTLTIDRKIACENGARGTWEYEN